jgi:ACR3 family arsenite transporter
MPERSFNQGVNTRMSANASSTDDRKMTSVFERYLTLWVLLCILAGIALGKLAPGLARYLDGLAIHVDGAPVVSIPIAVCLFFMMYPIMVKIDFGTVIAAGKSGKPVFLTLFVNWCIKPFTMYGIALFFLGTLFYGFIGPEAVDYVKMPFGLDLPVGASHGAGTVMLVDGVKMLQIPLWRSYLAGCILLGIAPCTAMVLVWGFLARGNDGLTLVMVAINSLTMLVLYGVLGGFLLGVGKLPVPWQALLLSILIYVALPLVAGYLSRRWVIAAKGEAWFREKFLHVLTPITIIALLVTLVLLFSFKGETIVANPLTILWIAIPLFIQTVMVFALGYGLARKLRLSYADAAPAAMIGASNHFEVAIATATMLFGLSSGAALATVVGVLIEVPVMLMLVKICTSTRHWFKDVLNGMTMPEAPADIMNRLETLQQQVNQLACQGQTGNPKGK